MKPSYQNLSTEETFTTGDKCFLFSAFSIDPYLFLKLPIELCPGIFLVSTPQHALVRGGRRGASEKEHIALGEWVYPGYALGLGVVNACIKIDFLV